MGAGLAPIDLEDHHPLFANIRTIDPLALAFGTLTNRLPARIGHAIGQMHSNGVSVERGAESLDERFCGLLF